MSTTHVARIDLGSQTRARRELDRRRNMIHGGNSNNNNNSGSSSASPPAARSSSETKASLLRRQLQHPDQRIAPPPRSHSSAAVALGTASPPLQKNYFVVGLHSPEKKDKTFGSPPPPPVSSAAAATAHGRGKSTEQQARAVKSSSSTARASASPPAARSHFQQFLVGNVDANFPLQQQQPAESPPPVVAVVDADAHEAARNTLWQLFQSCSRMQSVPSSSATSASPPPSVSPVVVRQRRMTFSDFCDALTQLQRRRDCHPVSKEDGALLWRLACLNEVTGSSGNGRDISPDAVTGQQQQSQQQQHCDRTIGWQSFFRVVDQRVMVTDSNILEALKNCVSDDEFFALLPEGAVPLVSTLMQPETAAALEVKRRSQSREPSQPQQEQRDEQTLEDHDVSIQLTVVAETPTTASRVGQQQQQHQHDRVMILSPDKNEEQQEEQQQQPRAILREQEQLLRFAQQHGSWVGGPGGNTSRPSIMSPQADSPGRGGGIRSRSADPNTSNNKKRSVSPNLSRGQHHVLRWNQSPTRASNSRVAAARSQYSDPVAMQQQQKMIQQLGGGGAGGNAPQPRASSAQSPPRYHHHQQQQQQQQHQQQHPASGIVFQHTHQSSPPSRPHARHSVPESNSAVPPTAVTPRLASRGGSAQPQHHHHHHHHQEEQHDQQQQQHLAEPTEAGRSSSSVEASAIAHHRARTFRGLAACPTPVTSPDRPQQQQQQQHQADVSGTTPRTAPSSAVKTPRTATATGGAAHSVSGSHVVERAILEQQAQAAQLQSMVVQRTAGAAVALPPRTVDDMMHNRFVVNGPDSHGHGGVSSRIAAIRCPHRVSAPAPMTVAKDEQRMMKQHQEEEEEQERIMLASQTMRPEEMGQHQQAEEEQQQPDQTPAHHPTADASPLVMVSPDTPAPEEQHQAQEEDQKQEQPQQPLRVPAQWQPTRKQQPAAVVISQISRAGAGARTESQQSSTPSQHRGGDDQHDSARQNQSASASALDAWRLKQMPPPPPRPVTTPRSGSASARGSVPRTPPAGSNPSSPTKMPPADDRLKAALAKNKHWK